MDLNAQFGINAHLPSAEEMAALSDLGAPWVRLDLNGDDLQPTREGYTYDVCDAIIHPLVAQGFHIYATLSYTPTWMNGGKDRNAPPERAQDWYNFVGNVCTHYDGVIRYWSLWNEPNQSGFFAGSVAQYVNLVLEPGYQALRTVNHDNVVCGPDLATMSGWRTWLDKMLKRGGHYLNVITVHAYDHSGHSAINLCNTITTRGKPLWVTEMAGTHDTHQANFLSELLESLPRSNVMKVFYFDLAHLMADQEAYQVYRRSIRGDNDGRS